LLENLYYAAVPDVPRVFLTSEALACLAGADGGCDAIEECVGLQFDHTGPCARSCVGDTSVACDGTRRFSVDCTREGSVCDPSIGVCVDPAAAACDPMSFAATCRDGAPVHCAAGREEVGFHCVDYGWACDEAGARCVGSGAECSPLVTERPPIVVADGIRCTSAAVLEACVERRTHPIRCTDISAEFSCQTRDGRAFCGLGDACDPYTRGARCEGDDIVFCNAGAIARVDCTSLGFTGCTEGGFGDGAHCSPSWWHEP
jgi:hypothetical protein